MLKHTEGFFNWFPGEMNSLNFMESHSPIFWGNIQISAMDLSPAYLICYKTIKQHSEGLAAMHVFGNKNETC